MITRDLWGPPEYCLANDLGHHKILPCFFRCVLKHFVYGQTLPNFIFAENIRVGDGMISSINRSSIKFIQFVHVLQDGIQLSRHSRNPGLIELQMGQRGYFMDILLANGHNFSKIPPNIGQSPRNVNGFGGKTRAGGLLPGWRRAGAGVDLNLCSLYINAYRNSIGYNVLFLLHMLLCLLGLQPEQTSIAGYKAKITTRIFEDCSLWRSVELDLNPDIPEGLVFKKARLEKYGYNCREIVTDSSLTLTAERVFLCATDSCEFEDAFGSFRIRRIDNEILFREQFSNHFLMDEVQGSMVRQDTAAAKVLLADTQFDFKILVSGKMVRVNIGEFDRNSAWWRYDIEELYSHEFMVMEAVFSVERRDTIAYVGFFIGGILVVIALLFLLKYYLAWRATGQNKA